MGATLDANSYSSIELVETRTKRRLSSGAFDDTTYPTADQVRDFIDEVSAITNVILAQNGFTVPVDSNEAPDVVKMLDSFVADEVASIVEGLHGSGRFGPRRKQQDGGMTGRYELVTKDAKDFIEQMVFGIEELGADREHNVGDVIGFRQTDDDGDDVEPYFKRSGDFGEVGR